MKLDAAVRYIKGVGETREKLFSKLGIYTLSDLVGYFPRTYEDRTQFKLIGDLVPDETVCVRAMAAEPRLSRVRRGLDLVKLRAIDDTGALDITFFNQSFVKDAIKPGETYIFYGKVSGTVQCPAMTNPQFERDVPSGEAAGRIMPVYPLTAGLSQKMLRNAVKHSLTQCGDEIVDILPEEIVQRFELCRARFAYENIHFPGDEKSLELARRRLIFEELFILAAAMKLLRAGRSSMPGRVLDPTDFGPFYSALPFNPTGAQRRAIEDAVRDMTGGNLMNRLVQGDVGSGKTVVAAACCFMAYKSGAQSAVMVYRFMRLI